MSESSTTPHENPVTGERITFHKTSRDTGGEYVLIEAAVAPGGGVASHVHPYQTEEFEIQSGSVEFRWRHPASSSEARRVGRVGVTRGR